MRKQSHREEAKAILIQTQANFVSQLAESKKENDKTMKEIRNDFSQIRALFLRCERILSELPEAIRQKIGFQPC